MLGQSFAWNRANIYMGAISNSEPISIWFAKNVSRPKSVTHFKFHQDWTYIAGLVHQIPKIGRKYIWEQYQNLNRFQYNLANLFVVLIPWYFPNRIKIGQNLRVWSINCLKSGEHIYGSYMYIWTDMNQIWHISF